MNPLHNTMDTNTTNKMDDIDLDELERKMEKNEIFAIFGREPAKPLDGSKEMSHVKIDLVDYVCHNDPETFCRRFEVAREFLKESLSDEEVEKYLPANGWFNWMNRALPDVDVDMRTKLKAGLDKLSSMFDVPISVSLNRPYSGVPIIQVAVLKAANMIERKFLKEETDFSKISSIEAWIKEHGAEIDDMMKPLGKAIVNLINDINKDYGTDYVVLKDMTEYLRWVVYSKSDVSPGTLFLGVAEQ